MAEYDQGVIPDSPPGTSEPPAPPSGPDPSIQVGGAPAQVENAIPHSRVKEMVAAARYEAAQQAEARAAATEQRLQQVQQQWQQLVQTAQRQRAQQTGQGLSPEERQAYTEGIVALKKLMNSDPEMRQLLEMRQAYPHLMQGYQAAQQQQLQAAQGRIAAGQETVKELAIKAGLPDTPQVRNHLENNIRSLIEASPAALRAFWAGDPRVIPWAFKQVQDDYLSALARPGQVSVAQTKSAMGKLPPPLRGSGLPASPAAPKLVPGKEREYTNTVHEQAFARFAELERLKQG